MKRKLFLIFLLSFLLQAACSQIKVHPTIWTTFISAGYSNATSGEVRDYYDNVIKNYNSVGIPIPSQKKFGQTVMMNAGILFDRVEDIRFGISFGYWYTPAYSNYKDNAGTLKINGTMSSFDISLRAQITIWNIGDFPIFLIPQLGMNHASSSISQELRFSDFPLSNYNSKWSASSWGPCAQLSFGSSVQLGEFTVLLEGGYRYTSNVVSEETIESSAGKGKMYQIWNIGLNGFVFLVSFEMKL